MATTTKPTEGQTALIPGTAPAARTLEEIECEHLARWMEKNGCKPPTITKRWLDAARRLREIDGRTHEQIMAAIDWSQRSEFWQANIHSMPTLREKYDVLRQQAIRDHRRSKEGQRSDRRGRQASLMDRLKAEEAAVA